MHDGATGEQDGIHSAIFFLRVDPEAQSTISTIITWVKQSQSNEKTRAQTQELTFNLSKTTGVLLKICLSVCVGSALGSPGKAMDLPNWSYRQL